MSFEPGQEPHNAGKYKYRVGKEFQRCSQCKTVRTLDKFYDTSNGNGFQGKRTICKFCEAINVREWRRENKDHYDRYQRDYKRKKYHQDHYFRIVKHPWPEFEGSLQSRREFKKTTIAQWVWEGEEATIVLDPHDGKEYRCTLEGLVEC